MKLKAVMLLMVFALLGVSYIQAVVVGPQQLHNNNRNGYRYNGPAHKYLPAEVSHGSSLDSDRQQEPLHRQQGFNGPHNSQYYEGQQQHGQQHQQHRHQSEEDDSTQSGFSQQQHQSLAHQQHFQNVANQAYNKDSDYQQPHGLGHQQRYQSSDQEQHNHHLGSNQHQNNHEKQHQGSGHQINEHSYETAYPQQQQQHHQHLSHQQHPQQTVEPWNAVHQQQQSQEGGSWPSSQGHSFQHQQYEQFQPQQHQQQQQQNNRFEQQLPLRGDLWQPIRELDLEKLPSAEAHANSHKTIANPGRDQKLVPSYTLSSDLEHDRFIGLDALDTRLLTQSLPNAYRKQTFSSPSGPSSLSQRQHEQQLAGSPGFGGSHGGFPAGSAGSADFLQMQSHSYQLPSTHSIHRKWPQNEESQQQLGSQQQATGNRQYSASAYAVSPPYLHSSFQPSQSSKNSLNHPSRDFQPPYY
ncbi:putative mediator of RNA polymerase II transcription subunit 26 [Drosophila rhopaloa]|uniref:Mediator of RNA polymerase II transcription subunit 26 n=1 Tax=Drosophila rhopaloa TaxID=1041015 RepID=A0A6P4F7U2_DRORH|nr:putative mediator of RNA polymerase II transcription subunit 26 [Drosophila rhopaloa]